MRSRTPTSRLSAIALETRTEALMSVLAMIALGFLVHSLMTKQMRMGDGTPVPPEKSESSPTQLEAPRSKSKATFAA